MAREKIDLSGDLDNFDLDSFDFDFDFETKPPKNKREAITRSVGDFSKNMADEFKPTKDNIKKFLESAVPNQLYSEYSTVVDGIDRVKDTFNKSSGELKKNAREANNILKKILPKGGKIEDLLNKIDNKLKDEDAIANMIKSNNERLLEGLQTELQNQFTKEATLQLVNNKQQLEKTNNLIELTKIIAKNTTVVKNFHIEVTNNYYRKSLELQFKQLFAIKEQTEIQRGYYDLYKNQYAEIVKNTSLPDIIKVQNKEIMEQMMKQKGMEKLTKFIFQDIAPVKRMVDNITRGLKNKLDDFITGMQLINGTAERVGDMSEMAGGMMSPAAMLGFQTGDWLRGLAGKWLGNKLAATKHGKRAVYNIKNAVADPSLILEQLAGKMNKYASNRDGMLGNLARMSGTGLNTLASMGKAGEFYRGKIYSKKNLDAAAIFDNKTQISIVETIPGYLAKIYGELKANRVGGNAEDHEVYYDHNRQDFLTKNQYLTNIQSDIKSSINANMQYNIESISNIYKQHGGLGKKDLHLLCSAIFTYMTTPSPRETPSILAMDEFLRFIPDDRREVIRKASRKVLDAAIEDYGILSSLQNAMHNVRIRVPSPDPEINEMFSLGRGKWVQDMGWSTYNQAYQSHSVNTDNVMNYLRGTYEGISRGNAFKSANYKWSKGNPNNVSSIIVKGGKITTSTTSTSNPLGMSGPGIIGVQGAGVGAGPGLLSKLFGNSKKTITVKEARAMYFNSVERKTGNVHSFDEWLGESGIVDQYTIVKDDSASLATNSKEVKNVDKMKNKLNEQIQDQLYGMMGLDEKNSQEALEQSRAEYFASEERKRGDVHSFDEWLGESGKLGTGGMLARLKSDFKEKGFFGVTRKLDRMIFKGIFKVLGKVLGLGWKAGKWGLTKGLGGAIKGAGWFAKEAVTALPSQLYYLFKGEDNIDPTDRSNRMSVERKTINAVVKDMPQMTKRGYRIGKSFFNKLKKGAKISSNYIYEMAAGSKSQKQREETIAMGLDSVRQAVEAMNPDNKNANLFDRNGDGERDGGWRSRLKSLFTTKKKEVAAPEKANKGIMDWIKENKGISTSLAIMGILGVLKALGVSAEGIVKGVKTTVEVLGSVKEGISKGFEFIGNIFSKFKDGVKGVSSFLFGEDTGEKVEEVLDTVGEVGKVGVTVAAAGAGAYALRHPIKATSTVMKGATSLATAPVKFGLEFFNTILSKVGKSPAVPTSPAESWYVRGWNAVKDFFKGKMSDLLNSNKDKIVKIADSKIGSFKKVENTFSKFSKVVKNEKVIKKVGKSVIAKAAAKITAGIAAASTGIGAILTAAGVAWELGWTLWYMYSKEMSFMDALSYQLLGVTWKEIKSYFSNEPEMEEEEENEDTPEVSEAVKIVNATNEAVADKTSASATTRPTQIHSSTLARDKNNSPLQQAIAKQPSGTLNPNTTGSSAAATAGAIAGKAAFSSSKGRCAEYVRVSLNKAGIPLPTRGSAYMHANGSLASVGFQKLNVSNPLTYKPEPGDVYVLDRFQSNVKNHPHGHIAIYDGDKKQWVSDFRQKNMNIYSDLSNDRAKDLISVWRMPGSNTTQDPGDNVVDTGSVPAPTEPTDAMSSVNIDMATSNNRSTTSYTNNDRMAPSMDTGVLNTISNTLSRSLEVQLRMADSLDKLTSFPGISSPSKPNTEVVKSPDYPVSMKRNTYG